MSQFSKIMASVSELGDVDPVVAAAYALGMRSGAASVAEVGVDRMTFLKDNYPKELAAVTSEWLGKLVEAEVASFESLPLVTGQISDAAIITPSYVGKPGPSSFVLKYAKSTEIGRQAGVACNMYEKELIFYASMNKEVGKFIPVPEILGTFEDPVEPETYFCIAMENLSEGWDLKNQLIGLSLNEAKQISQMFAKLHANYWESDTLKQDWLATKSVATGEPVGTWFDALILKWLYEAPATESKYASGKEQSGPAEWLHRYEKLFWEVKELEMFVGPKEKEMGEKLKKYPIEIYTKLNQILLGRPKTLCHGDLRSDNIFVSQADPDLFKIIDWQTISGSAAGVEFVEMLSGALTNVDDYDRLDEIIDPYLETLHANSEASKAYTKELLVEDFAAGTLLWLMALIPLLFDILEPQPSDSPFWQLMIPGILRFRKCMEVIGCSDLVERVVSEIEAEKA